MRKRHLLLTVLLSCTLLGGCSLPDITLHPENSGSAADAASKGDVSGNTADASSEAATQADILHAASYFHDGTAGHVTSTINTIYFYQDESIYAIDQSTNQQTTLYTSSVSGHTIVGLCVNGQDLYFAEYDPAASMGESITVMMLDTAAKDAPKTVATFDDSNCQIAVYNKQLYLVSDTQHKAFNIAEDGSVSDLLEDADSLYKNEPTGYSELTGDNKLIYSVPYCISHYGYMILKNDTTGDIDMINPGTGESKTIVKGSADTSDGNGIAILTDKYLIQKGDAKDASADSSSSASTEDASASESYELTDLTTLETTTLSLDKMNLPKETSLSFKIFDYDENGVYVQADGLNENYFGHISYDGQECTDGRTLTSDITNCSEYQNILLTYAPIELENDGIYTLSGSQYTLSLSRALPESPDTFTALGSPINDAGIEHLGSLAYTTQKDNVSIVGLNVSDKDNAAAAAIAKTLDTTAQSDYKKFAKAEQDASDASGYTFQFTISGCPYFSDNYISMNAHTYEEIGGPHGTSSYYSYIFDAKTGKQLTLRDVTGKTDEEIQKVVASYASSYIEAGEIDFNENAMDTIKNMKIENYPVYMDGDLGFTFYFDEGTLASDGSGEVCFTIPYAEFGFSD